MKHRTPRTRPEIERITPYVPGKPVEEVQRELGLDCVIKLASNENPLGPSPKAIQALEQNLDQMHIYPDGACHSLKRALSTHYQLPGEHIVIGNGSDEIIKLIGEAYFIPGDNVVISEHTFGEYAYVARLMGVEERYVPMTGLTHDLKVFQEAIDDDTKAVFVCNPNNPTGTVVEPEELLQFAREIPDHALLIIDEAYYEYSSPGALPDCRELLQEQDNLAILRTFSKIYGLAGLRIGYGLCSKPVARAIERVSEPFNVNRAAQIAACAALDDAEHLERSRQSTNQGKATLTEGLRNLGLDVVPSETNFLLVDLHRDCRPVFEALLRLGVIIRTGDIFGLPTHIRVTIGTPDQNQKFLSALKQVLRV